MVAETHGFAAHGVLGHGFRLTDLWVKAAGGTASSSFALTGTNLTGANLFAAQFGSESNPRQSVASKISCISRSSRSISAPVGEMMVN